MGWIEPHVLSSAAVSAPVCDLQNRGFDKVRLEANVDQLSKGLNGGKQQRSGERIILAGHEVLTREDICFGCQGDNFKSRVIGDGEYQGVGNKYNR